MLRFFRQIRRRLLTENRFSKYLLYAVGEILLVVIGILIALQVDNWNEERIAAKETQRLFKEVSDELVLNINNIDRVLDLYLQKDSIYFNVLNKRIEIEEFRANKDQFPFLLWWNRVSLVDDDFQALLSGKNNLTKRQDSLFSELKNLYGVIKTNTDRNDQMVADVHLSFRDKLMNEQPWWSSFSKGFSITDENFDDIARYFLTDPFYLNQIGDIRLREGGHYRGMLWFRAKALELYKGIAEMLTVEKDSSLSKSISDFEQVKGAYKLGEEKREIRGIEQLKWIMFRNDSIVGEIDILPYSKSYLILFRPDLQGDDDSFMFRIVYGENQEVFGLILIQDMQEEDGNRRMWKKID